MLGPHLGITEAPALYDTLTEAASQGSAVTLDGSSVDRIHTPAMQLLKAFMQDAEKSEISVQWEGVSKALRESTDLMGLSEALGIPPANRRIPEVSPWQRSLLSTTPAACATW